MERFSFEPDVAFVPKGDLLDRVTVAPLTQSLAEGARVQAAVFHIAQVADCVAIRQRTRRSSPSSRALGR